jgi:hypothetical protein
MLPDGSRKAQIADAIWLLDRLLHHLGARGADLLERAIEVVGDEKTPVSPPSP